MPTNATPRVSHSDRAPDANVSSRRIGGALGKSLAARGAPREPFGVIDGRGLPSGTVTFVLTDIEGSTKHAHALGDEYSALIGQHHQLLRAVWQRHGGHEVFTEGDAFIVAFGSADDAVLAAVDAQRCIAAEPWIGGRDLRVRIGLHAGYARPVDGDYRALALNQAARVVGCAHGGQTFATDEVAVLVTDRTRDVSMVPLGRYRVRDFDAPARLHAVIAAGMPIVDAVPRVRPAEGHNIVPPTSPLLGRDQDVAAVLALLAAQSLTTIAGPGGVGKTRVAMDVAMRAAPDWPDGAWLVDLASVTASVDVPSAIAQAIGAPHAPGQEVWPNVLVHLESRRALLVLDNCEHLSDGVALLVHDLLARCAGCGVLATSRLPLGLLDERIRRLGMLPVAGRHDPGVQLFLQRATDSTRLHLPGVIALCRELDGLPLAIELAAARTSVLPVADILARLRAAPTVLQSRDPSLPDRHRSLTRSLDWSHDLLDTDARAVYGRLSVFAAGFDLEAAESVCAGGDVDADDVAELLWALVDASLVQLDEAAGTTRYRMLTVVRSHAASKATADEAAAAMRRLARFEVALVGPDRPVDSTWRGAMELELDNVRSVVRSLAESHDADEQAIAQTLVWSIGRHHDIVDGFRAGINELSRWALVLTAPSPERAAMLAMLAELHLRLGEVDEASRVVAEGEGIAAGCAPPSWDNTVFERTRGDIAVRRGDLDSAIEIARAALPRASTPRAECRLLNLLGLAYAERGDNAMAADVIRREIDAAERAGMETFLVNSYSNLAEILLRSGDLSGAAASQLDCLELSRTSGGVLPRAFCVVVAAHLAADEAEWILAVQLQAAADVELGRVEWALYGEDADRRRRLLDDALVALGERGVAEAEAAGASWSIDAAADIAAAELRRVAAKREEPV
jgi:predicted ATPase/class 3 adenylate cyclase